MEPDGEGGAAPFASKQQRLLSAVGPDALARVTAPVHVVEGSETSAVDHAICDIVRRHVPHAQHPLIEGADHMMPLTHPEPLTRALLRGIER
jgi:lipase